MTQKTIDEVLKELDDIIDSSVRDKNYIGIFAYVYRRTTAQIKSDIELGKFENNVRLQNFDIAFANLYLDAYRSYTENKPISKSWEIAFNSKNERLTIIQHLMMGMNAHINLDLAIAASSVMVGKPINELENDFHKVNEVLAGLLNEMQVKIGKVSKLMFLLDWIGKRTDEKIINFSMAQARTNSWRIANELRGLQGEQRQIRIDEADLFVRNISAWIKSPKSKFLKYILKLVSAFEEKNTEIIISKFKE
jgi:hypothetical protein